MKSPPPVPAPESGPATVRLSIHGRVQGVGFRDAFEMQAIELGVDGWVRNRIDGSVEAVIRGEAHAVEALIRWAQRGPPAARVERVERHLASGEDASALTAGFRRLRTT